MKRHLLLSVAASALIVGGQAMAAPPNIYNWTGFYLGVNAGADWARSDRTTSATQLAGFTFPYFLPGDLPIVNAAGTGSMTGSGFTGGVQAGYNWQFNSAVIGFETDFDAFHGKASRTTAGSSINSGGIPVISSSIDAHWLFTARGRLGWAFDNWLPYVTGGLAVTHLSATNSYVDNTPPAGIPSAGTGTWSASETKSGWVVGGGLEWAFSQHWSARAEYLHVHFDAINASGIITNGAAYGSAINTSTDLSADIARAGLSYKF